MQLVFSIDPAMTYWRTGQSRLTGWPVSVWVSDTAMPKSNFTQVLLKSILFVLFLPEYLVKMCTMSTFFSKCGPLNFDVVAQNTKFHSVSCHSPLVLITAFPLCFVFVSTTKPKKKTFYYYKRCLT